MRKHDLALEFFSSIIGSNFKSVESYFLSGFIAWKAGNSEEAQRLFESAVKYSKPEIKDDNTPGEGDTKEGNSYQRKNQNILFYAQIQELSNLEVYIGDVKEKFRH